MLNAFCDLVISFITRSPHSPLTSLAHHMYADLTEILKLFLGIGPLL